MTMRNIVKHQGGVETAQHAIEDAYFWRVESLRTGWLAGNGGHTSHQDALAGAVAWLIQKTSELYALEDGNVQHTSSAYVTIGELLNSNN